MAASPEDRLTGWLRQRVAGQGLDLIGDDAAFLPGNNLAVTVDQQVEGVHFPVELTPERVGRRLVAVNLSDVAAVGGRPTFGFLALTFPHRYRVRRLLGAVERFLAENGARLAGGDLSAGAQLNASLTVLAERPGHGRWVRRSSAVAGDFLWIGGTAGGSGLGRALLSAGARFRGNRLELPSAVEGTRAVARCARRAIRRHIDPTASLDLGVWLSRRRRAAAIDISDGLLLDLERLCRESQVGAAVDAKRIPTLDDFHATASAAGLDPNELILAGGEDYVLLFTLPPTVRPPIELGATCIGRIRKRPGIEIEGAAPPSHRGWDHLLAR